MGRKVDALSSFLIKVRLCSTDTEDDEFCQYILVAHFIFEF